MTKVMVQFFYLFTGAIIVFKLPAIFWGDYENAHFQWMASFLNYLPARTLVVQIISLFTLLFSFVVCLKPNRLNRTLFALLFSIFAFGLFPHGKINHTHHLWMFSAFTMIFIDPSLDQQSSKNKYATELIQVSLLITYFIAGLWKIRDFLGLGNLQSIYNQILNQLASAIAVGLVPQGPINLWIENQPGVLATGFMFAVLFQISSLIPVFKSQLRLWWGWMAILFHIGTGIVFGVWFVEQILLVVYFLIILPEILRYRKLPL